MGGDHAVGEPEFLEQIGMDRVAAHDRELVQYALDGLAERPWVTVIGPTSTGDGPVAERVGCVSFTVEGVHPHDVGQIVDDAGVAIRTGVNCGVRAMPPRSVSTFRRAPTSRSRCRHSAASPFSRSLRARPLITSPGTCGMRAAGVPGRGENGNT